MLYLATKWNWNIKFKYSSLLAGLVGIVQTLFPMFVLYLLMFNLCFHINTFLSRDSTGSALLKVT